MRRQALVLHRGHQPVPLVTREAQEPPPTVAIDPHPIGETEKLPELLPCYIFNLWHSDVWHSAIPHLNQPPHGARHVSGLSGYSSLR